MKYLKLLFPVLAVAFIFNSCEDEYENPAGLEFKGSFVWRYTNDNVNKIYTAVTPGAADVLFIEVKQDEILTYKNGIRDSVNSYAYAISRDNSTDVYTTTLDDPNRDEDSAYKYFATYSFKSDTLFLDTYEVKNNIISRGKVLVRSAYVRPGNYPDEAN